MAIRLVNAILAEQNDEWVTGRRYFSQDSTAKLNTPQSEMSELALGAADQAAESAPDNGWPQMQRNTAKSPCESPHGRSLRQNAALLVDAGDVDPSYFDLATSRWNASIMRGDVVLLSRDSGDGGRGFSLDALGRFVKVVSRRDVQEVYDLRIRARYKGHEFPVSEKEDDRVLLYGTACPTVARELGFEQGSDYRDLEKWVAIEDLDEICQVKRPVPRSPEHKR